MRKTNAKSLLSLTLAFLLIFGILPGMAVNAEGFAEIYQVTAKTVTLPSSGGIVEFVVEGENLPNTLYYHFQTRNPEDPYWSSVGESQSIEGSMENGGTFEIVIPANTENHDVQYRVKFNYENITMGWKYSKEITVAALSDESTSEVDKTALDQAIKEAERHVPEEYTKESFGKMQAALKDAKAAFDAKVITAEEVKAKADALNKAVAELTVKEAVADASKLIAKVVDQNGKPMPGISFDLNDASASNSSIDTLTSDSEGKIEYSVENLFSGRYNLKKPFRGDYICKPSSGIEFDVADGKIVTVKDEPFTGKEDLTFTLTKIGEEPKPEIPQASEGTLLVKVVDQKGNPFNEGIFAFVDQEFPNEEGMAKAPQNGLLKWKLDEFSMTGGEIRIAKGYADRYTADSAKIEFTCHNNVIQTVNGKPYDGKEVFTLKVTDNRALEIPVEKPEITSATAMPETLPSEGGSVTLSVAGKKLKSNLAVRVMDEMGETQIKPLKTIDADNMQIFTLVLPANEKTTDQVYRLESAIQGDLLSTRSTSITVAGKTEPAIDHSDAKITSINAVPDTVDEQGETVTLVVEGTDLTAENWGVTATAYLEGLTIPMKKFQVEVTEITENHAVITVPANTMVNTLEYKISAGAKKADGIEAQAETVVRQTGKQPTKQVLPQRVEMTDDYTMIVTMEKNVVLGVNNQDALRKLFFIADSANPNLSRIDLIAGDTISVKDNEVIFKFKETPQLGVTSAIYMKEGALKTEEGVNVREFSWLITSSAGVTGVSLEKYILDNKGGEVKGNLKGVRLDEIKSIEARIFRAGSPVATDIPVEITPGVKPGISFEVPENTTEFTQSYTINLVVDGSPVYGSPVVSVLAKGHTDDEQTLAALTITGNNKLTENENGTDITVRVSKQEGELKTMLKVFGTNLDSKKTEVRAIDENGIVWPVYHIPECDGTFRFLAIAGLNGNGVIGDGNFQTIEVLPPRLAGINKTYRIQIALDGVHFKDIPSVTLTVDNASIEGETGFTRCSKEDIKNVVVKYLEEETGRELAPASTYQGYNISMVQGLGMAPKQIKGYQVVKEPVYDKDNTYIDNGKNYVYEYRKVKESDPVIPDKPNLENPDKPNQEIPSEDTKKPAEDPQRLAEVTQKPSVTKDTEKAIGKDTNKTANRPAAKTASTKKAAKTGDSTNAIPFAVAGILGIAAVGITLMKRKVE